MADPNEPPVVSDAELASLTYEQLAALINEGNPEDFYAEALAFDDASGRLQQLHDDFLRESRQLQEFVSGEILVSIEGVTQRYVGWIDAVLEPMLNPGYAQGLRHAGDALATGQQRLRDLQAQLGAQDPAVPPPADQGEQTRLQALQILRDMGTAYRDIGGTFTPLPETTTKNNANIGDGPNANDSGPGNGPRYVDGRYRPDGTSFFTNNPGPGVVDNQPSGFQGTPSGHFVTGGGPAHGVFLGGGGPGAGGMPAFALGRVDGGASEYVVGAAEPEAQLCAATSGETAEVAPGAALSAGVLSSGVLGRPAVRTTAGDKRKDTTREKTTGEDTTEEPEDAEVLASLREGERPETVSAAVPEARTALSHDVPAVATEGAVSTVSAAVPATHAAPAVALTHGVSASVPAFDVRADFGHSVAAAGAVEPGQRGMHVPASAAVPGGELSTELSAMTGTFPMSTPGSPAAPAAGTSAASGHGMPTMPGGMMMGGGMGGMGGGGMGGGRQNAERFADVPVTPDAEVWDPARATGSVLGRPEPEPEPSEPSEPCAEQDVDAARLAALEAILGKPGERRS